MIHKGEEKERKLTPCMRTSMYRIGVIEGNVLGMCVCVVSKHSDRNDDDTRHRGQVYAQAAVYVNGNSDAERCIDAGHGADREVTVGN